jgi:Flp pilus assembly pilin Flp
MRHTPNERSRICRQRGQSMTEYVVIAAMLALVLFAASSPVGKEFAQAFRDFYSNLIFYISLP